MDGVPSRPGLGAQAGGGAVAAADATAPLLVLLRKELIHNRSAGPSLYPLLPSLDGSKLKSKTPLDAGESGVRGSEYPGEGNRGALPPDLIESCDPSPLDRLEEELTLLRRPEGSGRLELEPLRMAESTLDFRGVILA